MEPLAQPYWHTLAVVVILHGGRDVLSMTQDLDRDCMSE